jgi:hypothetical protein
MEHIAARFEVKRINYEEAYSIDGACRNAAEEFFSRRMRRAGIGHHHHIGGIIFCVRSGSDAARG